MNKRTKWVFAIGLLVTCTMVFFWKLGSNGLWDLDEALYANCARTIYLTHDYVTPRINGVAFYEKPPLVYWLAAVSFKITGMNEWGVRFPSAMASLILTLLIWRVGTHRFGDRAGYIAAFSFALCPLVFGSARQLTTDATLNICISSALFSYWKVRAGGRIWWAYCFWLFCALGVLAKGAPGLAFPVIIATTHLLISEKGRWRSVLHGIWSMHPLTGLALFTVVALPWHIAAYQANGRPFWDEYIIRQHIGRFHGGDTAHRAPFWFYFPGLLLGFFPWSFLLPAAMMDRTPISHSNDRLLLLIWIIVVFAAFSASGSKLISYILPLYPAAALLLGDWLSRRMDDGLERRSLIVGTAVALVIAVILMLISIFHDPLLHLIAERTHRSVNLGSVPIADLFGWITRLIGSAVLGTAVALILFVKKKPDKAAICLGLGMVAFMFVAIGEGLPLLNRTIISPVQALVGEGGKLANQNYQPFILMAGPPRRPSLLFYLPANYYGATEQIGTINPSDLKLSSPTYILTDKNKAQPLLLSSGVHLIDSKGGWALLYSDVRPTGR